jgi:hypothetical protein
VSDPTNLKPAVSISTDFEFGEVLPIPRVTGVPSSPPSLGPLAAFVGTWTGKGFNTIFRPDQGSATVLPTPAAGDNVLELNLTSEILSFSSSLGTVPNRGTVQPDIFLNGVPYLQSIKDVTTSPSIGIHLEPGLWMAVPVTQNPDEGVTLVRMASIPHGTTICAQGTSTTFSGAPIIPAVSITPSSAFGPGSPQPGAFTFPSQVAAAQGTARIPQDLTSFIAAGTITQAILDDPNTVLRNANAGLSITGGMRIDVATAPSAPLFGGGTDNIAFLAGNAAAVADPAGPGQNGQSVQLSATFWIEAVEHTIVIPPFQPGQPIMTIKPDTLSGQAAPSFAVRPPIPIVEPREIVVRSTQIQYSQTVILNFNGLSWPHVSVSTLVPAGAVPVPPSAWE